MIRPASLWNDPETAPQNEALLRLLGGRQQWLRRFGIAPLTGYTASKLLWLKEREPGNFARIRHILLPHDYLNFWLTGRLSAECGDASGTAFFDVRERTWALDVLNLIDGGTGHLARAVPPLLGPEDLAGHLRREAAQELGLSENCVVSAGGGDNMMGAIGTNNLGAGIVTLSLGTSSTVYCFSASAPEDRSGAIAPFCSSAGGWLPLVCTMNATNVVANTLALSGRTTADIEAALEATPPGAEGLTFLPFLNGERTPDLPGAKGTLTGITATNFKPAHLIRAAIEGVTFGILNGLDLVLAGEPPSVIHLIGGGARSASWRQLIADASGARVRVPIEEESAALGAAVQAMVAWQRTGGGTETIAEAARRCVRMQEQAGAQPLAANLEPYRAARAHFRQLLAQLYPEITASA